MVSLRSNRLRNPYTHRGKIPPFLLVLLVVVVFVLVYISFQSVDGDSVAPLRSDDNVCRANPYLSTLKDNTSTIISRKLKWLQRLPQHYEEADTEKMMEHTHARFGFFEEMAPCQPDKVVCIGGKCRDDTSKIACGTSRTTLSEGCVVYSIGGNNQWQFEQDIVKTTPCEVHTFDCTGPRSRFQTDDKDPRIHFHHICLGTEYEPAVPDEKCVRNDKGNLIKCGETWTLAHAAAKLGHKRIDLYKMDIEGFEWPIFQSWFDYKGDNSHLPMQVLVEVHYRTQFPVLGPHKADFKFPKDMIVLQKSLLELGYYVTNRDDNKYCQHCTELTLTRVQC